MSKYRPILLVLGVLLLIISFAQLPPFFLDTYLEHPNSEGFLSSIIISAFVGGALFLSNMSGKIQQNLNIKQVLLLTSLSWVMLVLFASIPMYLAAVDLSYTDAFFESMSGLTTTGATIIPDLNQLSKGMLLWRSIIQWLGGIGIIVMAMAILPFLRIGGMQLFRSESSDNTEKILPRAQQIAAAISGVYLFFTIICFFAYYFAGMTLFDAVNHSFTTIATAGFSTHNNSFAYFDNPLIEWIAIVFMLAGGIPYILYVQAFKGKLSRLVTDDQVKLFILMYIFALIITIAFLSREYPLHLAIRMGAFNITSIYTTTGFANWDYSNWGAFLIVFVFMISVFGGCTGSTTGGIKTFRFYVMFQTAWNQIKQLIQPHGVFRYKYNGRQLEPSSIYSVLSFFILFALCFTVMAIALAFTGLDFLTSISAAAATMANLGPGLGDVVGPAGNYSTLSVSAKWILSFGMLLGRLEIFTILILFTPFFWKK